MPGGGGGSGVGGSKVGLGGHLLRAMSSGMV